MSLSTKRNDEIRKLLDEYGIKHGPVVDTTRKQYEKKLEKAMESSDKTYYREEEETSYITYHSPLSEESSVDTLIRRGIAARGDEKKLVHADESETSIQFTSKTSTVNHSVKHSSCQYSSPPVRCGGSRWKVVWLLAVFAAVCYFAYWYLWK